MHLDIAEHIEAVTEWPLFRRRHSLVQNCYILLNITYFISKCLQLRIRKCWLALWLGIQQIANHFLNQTWFDMNYGICSLDFIVSGITRPCQHLNGSLTNRNSWWGKEHGWVNHSVVYDEFMLNILLENKSMLVNLISTLRYFRDRLAAAPTI